VKTLFTGSRTSSFNRASAAWMPTNERFSIAFSRIFIGSSRSRSTALAPATTTIAMNRMTIIGAATRRSLCIGHAHFREVNARLSLMR
jgi:hypothetical protein